MISSGDNREIKISDTIVKVQRVWGSGVKTCGSYWIGLEKVAFFVLPGFSHSKDSGCVVVLVGGKIVLEASCDTMEEAAKIIEGQLQKNIDSQIYGRDSLKSFQYSEYFNRGEMPVVFEKDNPC